MAEKSLSQKQLSNISGVSVKSTEEAAVVATSTDPMVRENIYVISNEVNVALKVATVIYCLSIVVGGINTMVKGFGCYTESIAHIRSGCDNRILHAWARDNINILLWQPHLGKWYP